MFGLRKWKRIRLARRPFPEGWLSHLKKRVPFYRVLPEKDREGFLTKLKLFAWEKEFTGARGFEITEEVRVVVAATAARLILRLDYSAYDRLSEVIVYPEDFVRPEESEPLTGEHHEWGVVVLSWPAVLKGLRDPWQWANTATHEFAHALDRADGEFDGTPRLRSREDYARWREVMSKHFLRLQKGGKKQLRVLDDYAGQDEAEFFAVSAEAFFGYPLDLREELPDLYRELAKFFGIDPAEELFFHPIDRA